MLEVLKGVINSSTILIMDGGLLTGFLIILAESFFPMLPLGAFVTLNINAFGFYQGLILSWIATIIGSYLTYLIFFYISNKLVYKLVSNKKKQSIIERINSLKEIPITYLVLLITLPFSPSCFINLLAGISRISQEKYLISLIIGKAFMITFWAYIGKSFINSLTNIKTIIFIIMVLIIAYLITKIISKKLKIE